MKKLFLGCCFVTVLGLVACGSDGGAGEPGPAGSQGSTGESGSAGDTGATGATGDQGEVGPQGQVGDIACGDSLIPAAEWHSVCGSNVGSCRQGQVQCRLKNVEGELVPYRTCFGEVAPAANSGRCDTDANCDGVLDDTTGTGDNVTFVKQALQVEAFVSGSALNLDITLKEGRCRNAKKHCLLPDGDVCHADANGVGVLWSDFVADPKEKDMGFECVSGADVRTWQCTVGDDGVARVTCTGARGL